MGQVHTVETVTPVAPVSAQLPGWLFLVLTAVAVLGIGLAVVLIRGRKQRGR